MNTQSVFDTGILSYNIGNEVIMDAVMQQLNLLFPHDFIIKLPIEDIGRVARRYNQCSQYTFVGGTNALNGDMRHYRQWDLSLHNAAMLKNVVLLGCGWFQYEQKKPTKYTRWALNRVLAKEVIHSVRDNYTLKKCKELDLDGVRFVNTGCPTLWSLTPQHIASIPKHKARSVIFTITDYNQNQQRDSILVNTLKKLYGNNIYFFPQGMNDIAYLTELGVLEGLKIINPRLRDFDAALANGADYVGTRLHAGIRALQLGCRSFIIGIDNRSVEMSKDFGLPVLRQENIADLLTWIQNEYILNLEIPWDAINVWRSQFEGK